MKLQILRPSAAPELLEARQCVVLRAVRVNEAVSPAEVVNPTLYPNANGVDLILQPGSIYRAFTGVAVPGLALRELAVEAAGKAFLAAGLRVERVEVAASSEVLVYFSLLKPMRFARDAQLFELRSLALGVPADPEVSQAPTQLGETNAIPVPQETRHIKNMEPPAAVPAAATPKVDGAAWLNTPDPRAARVTADAGADAAAALTKPPVILDL